MAIKYMQITPKTSGFLVDVNYDRPEPSQEFAYSDLDGLINGLIRLLGPVQPVTIGVDLAAPGSDIGCEHIQRPDGTSSTTWVDRSGFVETLDDDGWRVWEGSSRPPPGLKDSDTVEVKFRDMPNWTGPASQLLWGYNDHRRRSDIVAYRVVRL